MTLIRAEFLVQEFLIVSLDIWTRSSLAQEFIPLLHLLTKGAENEVCILRLYRDGVLYLVLFACGSG